MNIDDLRKLKFVLVGSGIDEKVINLIISRTVDYTISVKETKYEQAYNLLMEYWDCLPDEEKDKIFEKLENLGV